jgi:hypothetical protein
MKELMSYIYIYGSKHVVFQVHFFGYPVVLCPMDFHVRNPIKGLVNFIVNGPRGKL